MLRKEPGRGPAAPGRDSRCREPEGDAWASFLPLCTTPGSCCCFILSSCRHQRPPTSQTSRTTAVDAPENTCPSAPPGLCHMAPRPADLCVQLIKPDPQNPTALSPGPLLRPRDPGFAGGGVSAPRSRGRAGPGVQLAGCRPPCPPLPPRIQPPCLRGHSSGPGPQGSRGGGSPRPGAGPGRAGGAARGVQTPHPTPDGGDGDRLARFLLLLPGRAGRAGRARGGGAARGAGRGGRRLGGGGGGGGGGAGAAAAAADSGPGVNKPRRRGPAAPARAEPEPEPNRTLAAARLRAAGPAACAHGARGAQAAATGLPARPRAPDPEKFPRPGLPESLQPASAPCPRQPAPGPGQRVGTWEPRPCDQPEAEEEEEEEEEEEAARARAPRTQAPVPPMELRPWLLWVMAAAAGPWVLLAADAHGQPVFTNTWAVHVAGGPAVADRLARKHGFLNRGQIFGDYYHFWHRAVTKRSLSPHRLRHSRLQREPQVRWLEQQVAKRRTKRDLYVEPTDPKFPQQWYLSGVTQRDLNVKEAWAQGFTGRGVVVSILDDGIEKNHPDLAGNYDPGASFDVNDQDPDPQPRYTQMNDNRHGTRCAGEVAAVANNGVCGVGVAYNARIGGVRMLDGEVTDAVEARSLGLNPNHIHIYSASWGPEDDGKTVDGPARLAEEAFFRGVSQGRGGLGSIFVWASGNGGREHDSCNCDGYTNSIYTLSISSATQLGNVPWYSEACSSTLATTYSSGNQNEKQIVTTDLRQKCTESHTGTSASAPLAAGIIALALEANKNLTWRDMQHLVVQTSKPAHLNANDWATNGVGRKVSHSYGYGLLDAGAMVALAQNWTTVAPQRKCIIDILAEPRDIGKRLEVRQAVTACRGQPGHVTRLEHAQARLTLSYNRRGDLAIHLVSPMGTRSTLLAARPHDYSADGFNDWAFMTTHAWDEDPSGEWVLEIENTSEANNYGTLTKFTLVLYGTAPEGLTTPPESSGCKTLTSSQACVVCEEGFSLHEKSCVQRCPDGWTPQAVSTHYSAENGVEPIRASVCAPCHPTCATCRGPAPTDCLSCPGHSALDPVERVCSRQSQSSRESPKQPPPPPPPPSPPPPRAPEEVDAEPRARAGLLPSHLPEVVAGLSCAFIVLVFVTVFLVLQLRSGFRCRGVKVYTMDRGLISYKGLPPEAWQECPSDSEEDEGRGERTTFIRDQSAL